MAESMTERNLDLEAPLTHSSQVCHYGRFWARRSVGVGTQYRESIPAHFSDSTIAMSIIRMVIYYKALTGVNFPTYPLHSLY